MPTPSREEAFGDGVEVEAREEAEASGAVAEVGVGDTCTGLQVCRGGRASGRLPVLV